MTTMDSDSESQDSDDGRRFRFEATRKDATPLSHNRKQVSSHSGRSERRPSSQGRSNRDQDRRNNDRPSNRNRDSRSKRDSRQTSRDRDLDRRDRHSQNYLKDSKDAHDSKHLKHRNGRESKGSPTQTEKDDRETKESKDKRDSKDRKDLKIFRSHEKDPKNSRESRSSKDGNRKGSRDRSRSDRSSSDKHKVRNYEKHKSHSKDNNTRVKDDQIPEKSEKDVKASLALGQTENDLVKEVADSTQDGCTEFNISDFEIVSDLEEISSDASNRSHGHKSKVRKRQSKQQSLLLPDRDSERKSHRVEDLRKVNPRNGNHSSASSISNPSALSDFSLGSASPTTSANKKFKEDEEVATRMEVDVETSHDSSFSQDRNKSNESDKSYGPILPPKLVKSSSLRPADQKEEIKVIVKMEDVQNEDVERKDIKEEKLIGPLLPPSSFKPSDLGIEDDLSSSAKAVDLDREACEVQNESEKSNGNIREEESTEGCSQPRIIGPSLAAHLLSQKEESDEDAFGPVLPPHLIKKEKTSENKILGPTLPAEQRSDAATVSDNEDVIGPLPADHPASKTSIVQQSLEFRARRIQMEFMTEPIIKEKKREEWMTELPPVQAAALGLGPRKFKARAGPDLSDRSSWTDTPVDKARKEQEKAEERLVATVTEKEIIKEVAKEDASEKPKKRQKSLLEMHQKKLKKKKKKEEKEAREKGKPMRRPFDRDIDLEANRFDEAQKKHIFMKAQMLDDRFSRGKM